MLTALFIAALSLALTDPVPADPNSLDPFAHRPRLMLHHKWEFTSPTLRPQLPRGGAVRN